LTIGVEFELLEELLGLVKLLELPEENNCIGNFAVEFRLLLTIGVEFELLERLLELLE
jgi:hypothetical protein